MVRISVPGRSIHRTSNTLQRWFDKAGPGRSLPRMLLISVLLVSIAGSTQFEPSASAQSAPFYFGVHVDLVDVFATVHDRAGKLVTELTQDDFVIYDNGVAQPISQFSKEYIPLSVLILLDSSASMAGKKLDNAKKSLLQFLKRLNPGDEAMLMTFRARPRVLQSFTEDLDKIRLGLRNLEGDGSTALYDAILTALRAMPNAHNRRRALLLLSDGVNTYGKTELNDTISTLRKETVELFAIGMESEFPEDLRDKILTKAILDQLTHSAGGEAFIASDSKDLGRICTAISERMHNQYSLAYYPPRSGNSQWRNVRIETKVPGLTVVPSKTGYFPAAGLRPADQEPTANR